MYRTTFLSGVLALVQATIAFAGDTVTVNLPGGATQTVSASAIAAAINANGGLAAGDALGSDIIASVSINSATGEIVIVTVGGTTYSVTSTFIAVLLLSYS